MKFNLFKRLTCSLNFLFLFGIKNVLQNCTSANQFTICLIICKEKEKVTFLHCLRVKTDINNICQTSQWAPCHPKHDCGLSFLPDSSCKNNNREKGLVDFVQMEALQGFDGESGAESDGTNPLAVSLR